MLKFLSGTVKAGFGLAAIAAAVFWSVHQGFIQANAFSAMTPEQTFKAFIWSSGEISPRTGVAAGWESCDHCASRAGLLGRNIWCGLQFLIKGLRDR